jgi:HlyD family secretion protein
MANSGQSRLITIVSWFFGLLLIVFAFFFVRNLTRSKVEVRVARANFETLSRTVSTTGKVEPVVDYPAHVPFPGVVQQLYVHVGQHVEPGALLVQLNDSDAKARIASADAALVSAKVALRDIEQGGSFDDRNRFQSELSSAQLEQTQARTNLQTLQELFAKGAVSSGDVTAAQQRVTAADIALKNITARTTQRYNAEDRSLAQARVQDSEAALAAARNNESNVIIRSPIAGTVYSIPSLKYDFVPAGVNILDVADLTHLQVRAYFDEPEIGRLEQGQPVRITWDAKLDEEWHGHIERAPTTIMAYGTRNVGECLISIDDARGELTPNSNVTVWVTETQHTNVLSVPREALHTDGAKNFVYRIVNGKLRVTPVQVNLVTLNSVEIVSGLAPNDQVVLRAKNPETELTNGLDVKPIE